MKRSSAVAGAVSMVCALAVPPGVRASPRQPEPPAALQAGFVDLADVAPTVQNDMRYSTAHNFLGRRVAGYEEGRCLLTRDAAARIAQVQKDLRPLGYGLKVYDCYRPQRAVNDFVQWSKRLKDQRMKREFYPRVDKKRLFRDGYIAERSGHSRGSTLDLSLVRLPYGPVHRWTGRDGLRPCVGPAGARFPDDSVDMGTGFDCFDPRAHTRDPRSTPAQWANRMLLRVAMERRGFTNYEAEWWHYTVTHETYPTTAFDFPVARRSLTG